MNKKIFSILVMTSLLLTPFSIQAVERPWLEKYHIRDDHTGGECEQIGNWSHETKTCTLTKNFHKGIEIESNNITIDGNGHMISSDLDDLKNYGILIKEKTGVTIKNIKLDRVIIQVYDSTNVTLEKITSTNTNYAIYFTRSSNSTIQDNNISGSSAGMLLILSNNNKITKNKISNTRKRTSHRVAGIYMFSSQGNLIERNILQNIKEKVISLDYYSKYNTIKENTIKESEGYIFHLFASTYNEIYNNDLIDNDSGEQVYMNWRAGNLFQKDLPIGGNYWGDYDTQEEGCDDTNNNNICDEPYKDWMGRDLDMYPHKKPFNWEKEGSSNILFIPGIQASRLYKKHKYDEDQLWEPTNRNEDVKDLYMDGNGKSINKNIYTKEVIDEAYGLNIYKGFMKFLDEIKEDKTINEWEALPYDWRYSPDTIIENGILVEDEFVIDPVLKLESLAANSKNGKVAIVSHSNGGIFAKLLIDELKSRGKDHLIEKVVFVATPQAGTPKTLAGLLHGDELSMAWGIILDKKTARGLGENMTSAYNLLPSQKYFEMIETPVIEFSEEVEDIYDFQKIYGEKIDNYSEMKSFLLGDDGKRNDPSFSDTDSPNVLSKALFSKTESLHSRIDNWSAPEGMEVIQIAGWGLDTISGIKYDNCDMVFCDGLSNLDRDLVITMDGDETVVHPSALMMGGGKYYLNLLEYNNDNFVDREHANILEIDSMQEFIENVIQEKDESIKYISKQKPKPDPEDKRLRLKMKSPVDVHLFDENGNHTGLIQNPNPNSDLRMYESQIPNSYYWELGEKKYLGAGSEGSFEVELEGTDTGTFTFEIEEVKGQDEVVSMTDFSDIPVFEGMEADLQIDDGQVSEMQVDLDGDGVSDFSIVPGDDTMENKASLLILQKILNDLDCHKSVKRPLTQRMVRAKKLIEKEKTIPAKRLLGAMINHLEAVKKRKNLERFGISRGEIENLVEIISKVNLSI